MAIAAARSQAHSKSKPVEGKELAGSAEAEPLLLPLLAGTNVAVEVAAPTTTVMTGMTVTVGVAVGVEVAGVPVRVGVGV